jgi:hypothetical protein
MSVECSECERDPRGGHAEDCPRALPLMARREWMPSNATGVDFDESGVYWFDGRGFVAWATGWDAHSFPHQAYRIASHDEHGLPVVPREQGMPADAKYWWRWVEYPDADWVYDHRCRESQYQTWQRIEDFNEHKERT